MGFAAVDLSFGLRLTFKIKILFYFVLNLIILILISWYIGRNLDGGIMVELDHGVLGGQKTASLVKLSGLGKQKTSA